MEFLKDKETKRWHFNMLYSVISVLFWMWWISKFCVLCVYVQKIWWMSCLYLFILFLHYLYFDQNDCVLISFSPFFHYLISIIFNLLRSKSKYINPCTLSETFSRLVEVQTVFDHFHQQKKLSTLPFVEHHGWNS